MCGQTISRPPLAIDGHSAMHAGLPELSLPMSVQLHSLSTRCCPAGPTAVQEDVDSRSSTPRSHGHPMRTVDGDAEEDCGSRQAWGSKWEPQQPSRRGPAASSWKISPVVSPRSACSTPGGADTTMGSHLHALVFANSRNQHECQQRRNSSDPAGTCGSSGSAYSRQQQLLGTRHGYLHRNHTSQDLRRPSNSWGGRYSKGSSYMLNSIAALGLKASTAGSGVTGRGSISKAKQVLAEAINSIPGAHGFGDFSPATCDTGVLSPLLSIIRQDGCVSRRASFGEAASATSSFSSSSSACGFTCGSSVRDRIARLGPVSSTYEGDESCSYVTTLAEDAPAEVDVASQVEELMQHSQLQKAAQVQKVVDCIDTVKYLSVDDSNRMALIDLGAVELLLSKLQKTANPAPEVIVSALAALSAICKHDAMKAQLWDNPDSAVILQLMCSRHASPVVKAAHQAACSLAWSVDGGGSSVSGCCGGSVFDSVSSHISSADSCSSSCSGANVLLEPALVPALAAGLHPAADVPVLLSSLKLLCKAAASISIDQEVPAPPLSPDTSSTKQQMLQKQVAAGWHKVLFALMPLLIPTQRRQGHLVLGAALDLLVVLTEQRPELHSVVCASGCLAPLLAQTLEGDNERSLQAACILTGLVDTPFVQERMAQEPALAVLLRVLAKPEKSVDVRLAAVHMLRQLAASVPRCVQLLKQHGAVAMVVALLQEIHDSDVRRAAAGLLQLLGTPVVVRSRRSADGSSSSSSHYQQQQQQQGMQHSRFGPAVPYKQLQQQQPCAHHNVAVGAGAATGARMLY